MTDISRAERRLIAALDRLDHAVERGARRIAQTALMQAGPMETAPADGPDVHAAPDIAAAGPVSEEIAALHDRQAATLEAMQMRLAEAHDRLASAGAQAARLAAANDELSRANRTLIDAASDDWTAKGGDATRAALEAEIEALRAARAAEIAQMAEILDALDRMLGVTTTPRSHSTDARKGARGAGAAAARPAAAAAPIAAAAEAPRELTVVPDEPVPEETEDAGDSLDRDSRFAGDAPADAASSPLFGGVYDDDPGAPDTDPDDEERR